MTETVNHPRHYQHPSGVECWQLSAFLPHPLASAVEYIWRHEAKNGVEDLRKARWWLELWLKAPVRRVALPASFAENLSNFIIGEKDEVKRALIYDIGIAGDPGFCKSSRVRQLIKNAIRLLSILIDRAAGKTA